ncbi:unnamed protein product [Spirodela intermedia]|uniref:Uncharacterized protein n=1 Tax=Spirodela intermedia TaxID=51605 RepID=A0A7I8JDS9_SPIIN|nr:unnamed protein product [Spirodela intermedia]CAA6668314.1 unnamed protein product [Spirodela intermedia]
MAVAVAASLLVFLGVFPFPCLVAGGAPPSSPAPAPWPPQFHAILYANYSGALSIIDLWYDWPNAGELLYDLEWDNGTSFYYNLDASRRCRTMRFPVAVDGFLCNVWEKADFITYYEDVATRRPVRWVFYTGRSIHVMTFEEGAVLEDEKWQAPVYCFDSAAAAVASSG